MSKACRILLVLACLALAQLPVNAFWGFDGSREQYNGLVFAHPLSNFDSDAYQTAVDWIIHNFEERTGKTLSPGGKQRAALKVYTNSGEGMSTPLPLVEAVIRALERRGFTRSQLFIVDAKISGLRAAGFLPSLSRSYEGPYFNGVPVYAFDDGNMWDKTWFYENPLPVQFSSPIGRELLGRVLEREDEESRKSYLAEPLLMGVDFWINLPMVTDHMAMEVNGALGNATLWSINNRERFFLSPANAPVAMAEISAIPELLNTWALNLVTLERYQFIGGPNFNSLYTRTEPLLMGSSDPVALDAIVAEKMNMFRKEEGFPLLQDPPVSLSFAETLGTGISTTSSIQWIRPDFASAPMESQPWWTPVN